MNRPEVGEFCYTELATSNFSAAKDFYSTMFGWKFQDTEMDGMTYTMISIGDKEFGGMWQIPTDKKDLIPPHWMNYILVDHIQSVLDQAVKLGATIKIPVTKAGSHGCYAVIHDPTGAMVGLWESRKD